MKGEGSEKGVGELKERVLKRGGGHLKGGRSERH